MVKNHPFLDSNKRNGFACAWMFLRRNGLLLDADDPKYVTLTLDVATGVRSKEEVADFLRQNTSQLTSEETQR